MMDLRREQESTGHFMMGLWPFIERFPSFMAPSLLDTRYGRSPGDNLARRRRACSVRVAQNHVEYWRQWAAAAAVAGASAPRHRRLVRWREDICNRGTLAAGGMAATP